MTTEETIENLKEARARQILDAIARHGLASGAALELTPALRGELASAFGVSDAPLPPVTGEELARQALLVLAEDPATGAAIASMAAQPAAPQKFDFGAGLALTTAVLFVLQTHIQFERRKDGAWTLKVEKKPASDALLKSLVQKLLGYMK
jgi:hypothetical protein